MADLKTGPLTVADLQAIWESSTDRGYRDPLLAVGDGEGLEVWSQLWETLAAASIATDVTTQALFIEPWSGQTNPPAGGPVNATVDLTFTRTKLAQIPIILGKGLLTVGEGQVDWGPDGGVDVETGRLYDIAENKVLQPGESGPLDVDAIAQNPGYGYNRPRPGTLVVLEQPGTDFENTGATVTSILPTGVVVGSIRVDAAPRADMFVPEHVGQYLLFTAGSNAGSIAHISQFVPPSGANTGSAVYLDLLRTYDASSFSGTFLDGEFVILTNGGPEVGRLRLVGPPLVSGGVQKLTGVLMTGGTVIVLGSTLVTGLTSGATMTIRTVLHAPGYASETGTASWRILDWENDFGLSVTNNLSPAGGRAGMLDEIGAERNINRSSGEDDETYRQRVHQVADVVVPNAIRRTLNRVLGSVPWCFREVGTPALRGWFYDGANEPVGGPQSFDPAVANLIDAYDTDVIVIVGGATAGVFDFQEPVVLEDAANNVLASGYMGRLTGLTMIFIRTSGAPPASLVGVQVRGLHSGATLTALVSATIPASVAARRHRLWFDYEQFRGFFEVGVPRLDLGEFGFHYDAPSPDNAYDKPGGDIAYDGFAVLDEAVYGQVWAAIETVRAGGVAWRLYIEDGTCP